jgi:hypothetical protein
MKKYEIGTEITTTAYCKKIKFCFKLIQMTLPARYLLIISILGLFCFFVPSFANAVFAPSKDPFGGEGRLPAPDVSVVQKYFEQTQPQYQRTILTPPHDQIEAEGYVTFIFNTLINAIGFGTAGTNPYVAQETGRVEGINGGAIGLTAMLSDQLIIDPPVSTVDYIADLGNSLGVKPAYAQGTGWEHLKPVISIWKAIRNVAYLLFVLIFITVGFMIMFRAKINPQTVISVEAAIPNLIITLIIITFSYAIVSLMIDLIWVSCYLVINFFSTNNIIGIDQAKNVVEEIFFRGSVINIGTTGGFYGEGGIIYNASSAIGQLTSNLIWGSKETGAITQWITGNIVFVILSVAVLFSLFKLFFQLLLSYIGIIVSVIFAPLILLGNALPGSNALTNWFKGLLANVLVFPATVALFLLAGALTGVKEWGVGQNIGYANQQGVGLPLLAATNPDAIKSLVGIGMIMLVPKVVSMIKDSLKVEKGAGLGAAIAPVIGLASLPGQAVSTGIQIAQARQYIFPPKDKTQLAGPYGPPVGQQS